MILVLRATGNVGHELVGRLSERGQRVLAVVRRDDAELPAGVEAVKGDLNEIDLLAPALAAARAMFMLSGYPDRSELLQRGREAGLEHVVLPSASSAVNGNPKTQSPDTTWTARRTYANLGLAGPYFARTASFRSIAVAVSARGGRHGPIAIRGVPVVANDPLDIAAVAAGPSFTRARTMRRPTV